MSSGDGRGFFYSIIGFFVGLFFFVKGLRSYLNMRLIENIPTSKIRSIAMGLSEIYGEVVYPAGGPLKGPLSGGDCVYYRYNIDEYRREEKNSRWVTIHKGTGAVRFLLRDDTGTVLVDPDGAKIDIPEDYHYETRRGEELPANLVALMDNEKIAYMGLLGFRKTLRFSESHMEAGDKLYVMGTAGDNPFVEDSKAKESAENVMIHKGENEKFYYISDSPERVVLKKMRRKVLLYVLGGGSLSVACLTIIFLYLGML